MDAPDKQAGGTPAADEADHGTGQVLGTSVPTPREVTRAAPGSPETGAVRDETGRPSADKPHVDS